MTRYQYFSLAAALLVLLFACGVDASPPDPWIRMNSPSGCSGTVVHSSRQFGIFVVSCEHCSRAGDAVTVRFMKDGQRSAPVTGRCIRNHPTYDCSLLWFDPQQFYEMPQRKQLAYPYHGPYVNQNVMTIGSFAGGTWSPAMRSVRVASVGTGAYGFTLNDSAWGGHSGGGVCTVKDGQPDRYLGPLWGVRNGQTGLVTGPAAVWEMIFGAVPRMRYRQQSAGQALYSVNDEVQYTHRGNIRQTGTSWDNDVWVYGPPNDQNRIEWHVENSHVLSEHFDFHFRDSKTGRLSIVWQDETGQVYSHRGSWPGERTFLWQYEQTTGRKVQCPGGNCPPGYRGGYGGGYGGSYGGGGYGGGYGGSQYPSQPGWGGGRQPGRNPGYVFPPPPAGPDDPAGGTGEANDQLKEELEKLQEELAALREEKKKAEEESEDSAADSERRDEEDVQSLIRDLEKRWDEKVRKLLAAQEREEDAASSAPEDRVQLEKLQREQPSQPVYITHSGFLRHLTKKHADTTEDLAEATEKAHEDVDNAYTQLGLTQEKADARTDWGIVVVAVVIMLGICFVLWLFFGRV